jgi:hypothetical protein
MSLLFECLYPPVNFLIDFKDRTPLLAAAELPAAVAFASEELGPM